MENNKHIFLTMNNTQKLYENDVRYLIDFDLVKGSCGISGDFYYDYQTKTVVVAPYKNQGYFKAIFVDAHVESGDDRYRDKDSLELHISSSCDDTSKKEYTATGFASYDANYQCLDGGMPDLEDVELYPKIQLDASCLIGIPPAGATIFVEVIPRFGNKEDFAYYEDYEKSVSSAYSSFTMIGGVYV